MEKIVILGGGESGCGAAVLARVKGFDVFLSEGGVLAKKYRELLQKWKVPFEQGGHSEREILSASRVVKSPGIPDSAPMVEALRKKGVPILSEIEFAAPYCSAKTICITGSNGKTTTATLTYEMLRQGGMNVGLVGNIGQSFALALATQEHDWYVIELSSFQLDGMIDFKADIAVLMNITPDHLDRYNYDFQQYVNSKFRILQNQGPADYFIYCVDDPAISQNLSRHPLLMQTLPFGVCQGGGLAAGRHDGIMHAEVGHRRLAIALEQIAIQGTHNLYNAMASTLAALAAGVQPPALGLTLSNFAGVEHRLEPCGQIKGVRYINDSKATNVDSVWYALESMIRPVVWIAGGTDKGNDYSRLEQLVNQRVKALVCLGADNTKLLSTFAGRLPTIVDTHSMAQAVQQAAELAEPGDVVLLSPACASFDLFQNYEHRGEAFKAEVERLKERESAQ